MKIFIITGIYPPDIGGPAQYCSRLKHELEERGYQVSVLTYGNELSDDKKNMIVRILRNSNWLLRQMKAVWKIFNTGRISDVIYVNGLELPALIASVFLGRQKKIMKITKDFAWEYGQRKGIAKSSIDVFQTENKKPLLNILRKIQVLAAKKMNTIVVPSDYLKKIVTGWGIHENNVHVIKNGYKPPEEKKEMVKKTESKKKTLLTVGRFVMWKRIDYLVKMLSELSENYNMVIIGAGPQEEHLKNLISAHNLWKRVKFIVSLENSKVFGQMEKSDCLLLNSIYEGLSHVLIEAQFAGLPSVVTDVGGNREVIENGFNGFLVKPDEYEKFKESIAKICEDMPLKEAMKKNCIKKSRDFSWEKHMISLLQVFENGY